MVPGRWEVAMSCSKKKYIKPVLRLIDLKSRETLGLNCHTSASNDMLNACNTPFGACDTTP